MKIKKQECGQDRAKEERRSIDTEMSTTFFVIIEIIDLLNLNNQPKLETHTTAIPIVSSAAPAHTETKPSAELKNQLRQGTLSHSLGSNLAAVRSKFCAM
ncbi:hypothetical protein KC19_12G038200 [Ceratodon purpureus]|uniref:Uncharacterized protein n=1 Tax=Ceratodon purpureus TaxID=3225 RepID=A0A8T0G5S4_CERPU|nr:hypothetical protein KC19_12G038200 [Ceratodon purpureus]